MRRGALSRLLSFTPSVQPVALVGGSSSAGRPKITGKRFQTELLGDNRSLFAGFFDAPPRGPVAIDPAPVCDVLCRTGEILSCVFFCNVVFWKLFIYSITYSRACVLIHPPGRKKNLKISHKSLRIFLK